MFVDSFLLQTVGTFRHVDPLRICIFNAFGPFEPLLRRLVTQLSQRNSSRKEVQPHSESMGQFHYLFHWIQELRPNQRALLGWRVSQVSVRRVLLPRWAWDNARTSESGKEGEIYNINLAKSFQFNLII